MKSDAKSGRSFLFSSEVALLVAIVAVIVAAALLDSNHSYFRLDDIDDIARNIARNTALLGIFALGASVVIISGGIDLSAGSTIAFAGSVCACVMLMLAPQALMSQQPLGAAVVAAGVFSALAAGLMVGTLHAWLITAVRLPPFIATLATLVGLRSLGRAMIEFVTRSFTSGKNSQIYVYDPFFRYLRENVWVPVAVFLVLAVFTWIVLSRTVLGRHLYALGGNEQAARLSGIRTENVKWVAYCFAAITASIAGVFYIANESVAAPVNQGRGQELNAIAAAVVGGCSLQGGIGTVPGVVLGALFLQIVIDAVAKVIKTSADVYEGLIVGIVVVMAVTFSQFRQIFATGRAMFSGALGLCVIPVLVLLGAAIMLMTVGKVGAAGAGVGLLVLLGAAKSWEVARNRAK